jgi:NADH:ubiquinone oxidoreductase subunit 3 (subunit A)
MFLPLWSVVFIDAFDPSDNIFSVIIITLVLCSILVVIVSIAATGDSAENEHSGEYECGFEPFDDGAKTPFDVQFFIIGLLFLIFDVEISLLVPYILSLHGLSAATEFSCFIFIAILTYGFVYEWYLGVLSWADQQD